MADKNWDIDYPDAERRESCSGSTRTNAEQKIEAVLSFVQIRADPQLKIPPLSSARPRVTNQPTLGLLIHQPHRAVGGADRKDAGFEYV